MQLELNINKDKVLTELSSVRRSVTTAAADEQFSLILDQAVGETQEKAVAADNPPDTDKTVLSGAGNSRGKLLKDIGSVFDRAAGTTLAEQTAPKSKSKSQNNTGLSERPEVEAETEKTPDSAPVGLIQTQAEQIVEKNSRGFNAVFTEIDFSAEPAAVRPPISAPAPFAEIYAELLQNVQAKKDGQILKLKLALEPENLGKIEVYIFADKKNLHITFAAHDDVRKMLSADASALKDIMEKHGFSLADLDFSSWSGQSHKELESRFTAQESAAQDFGVLKTVAQNDIIEEVRFLLGKVLVHYLA